MRIVRVVGSRAAPPRRATRRAAPEPSAPAGPSARPNTNPARPISYLVVSLLFSALLFAIFLVSDHGFIEVGRQRKRLASLQADVSRLAAENEALEKDVAALQKDPKAVERIAREELDLVKPDEIVLVLPGGWKERVAPGAPAAPPVPAAPAKR